ncbi:hypothetical protein Fcan01_25684 [Folsomia candida]|uniref:Uncharacterized protein n=1 Tax=Folsomia candida TaxID=158441 RepID=A0A226D4C8_FOLCA|nr:hypothetical protein Fcan01_25684 [Folsomia candida]
MSTRRNYKSYFGSREGCAKVISIPIRTRHRIKRRWSAVDRVGLNNNTQPNLQCHNTSVGKSNEDLDDNLHPSLHQLNMNEDGEVSESGLSTTSDDDDDEDDYDQNKHHNKQYKIFPGAKLTTTESCMLILGFAIGHKLSKSAMSDLLTLINFHLPPGASIPSSMFLLNKMLGPDYTLAKKIPFCEKCQCIIENSDNCIKCGQVNVHKAIKDGNYFVSFDIGSVLKSLLEREAISNSIIKTFVKRANNPDASNVISDIVDGADYKKLKLKKYDLTCCLNTDGVSIFNSSGFSVWPLLLSINELDYPLRRKHTILGGLWLGKGKPNFSLFLNPFMKQAAQLSTEGIVWTANNKMMTSKIFFPLFAADSVARCQIQGINQFNGEYSCPWCLAKGQNLKISDSRHKWIFDPTEISVKRDKEIFVKHLLQLRDKLKQGSKIASNFRIKNMFDINLMPVIHNSAYSFLHNQLCREVVPVYAGFAMPFSYGWILKVLHTVARYALGLIVGLEAVRVQCLVATLILLTLEMGNNSIAIMKSYFISSGPVATEHLHQFRSACIVSSHAHDLIGMNAVLGYFLVTTGCIICNFVAVKQLKILPGYIIARLVVMSCIGCIFLVLGYGSVANLNEKKNQLRVMYLDSIVRLKGIRRKLMIREVAALQKRGLEFYHLDPNWAKLINPQGCCS